MLKIKLARFGKTKQPHYRVVINEAREKRDGRYVDSVGHYAPTQEPKLLQIDVAKFNEWVKKGAQPTDTVAALFKRFQSGNPFPERPARPSKKAKAKTQAAAQAAAEAASTPAAEEKVEEKTAVTTETASEVTEVAPEITPSDAT